MLPENPLDFGATDFLKTQKTASSEAMPGGGFVFGPTEKFSFKSGGACSPRERERVSPSIAAKP